MSRKTNKIKSKIPIIILSVIVVIYMGFIWIHSSMPADVSKEESITVLGFLDFLFKKIGVYVELTDHIVRKLAHFCEFSLLGFLVMWLGYLINGKTIKNFLSCGFVCLATATIDETIQLFSPGRAGMVVDILLDFSGVLCGFLFFIIIIKLSKLIRKSKKG